ncbi:MAG: phasin family protein [Methylocystis sp.]|nr:phasin family protein [Methylocystis sp.]
MITNFDSAQKLGKEQFDAFSAASAAVVKGWQSIAAEATDYSKKSFEKGRVLAEKLVNVKKMDEAFQLQFDYAKTAYDDFIAGATKIGELYASMAKEAFKPVETAAKTFADPKSFKAAE